MLRTLKPKHLNADDRHGRPRSSRKKDVYRMKLAVHSSIFLLVLPGVDKSDDYPLKIVLSE